ncbi:MAG: C45 family autoproteolytic acyltransferase/hydrolase [Methanothrix sp.]|nr:C45 family autoproteolytic acyltransferase/hydrolase [Methanothrix sp.]
MYIQKSGKFSPQLALVMLCIFVSCSSAGPANSESLEKTIPANLSSDPLNNSDPSVAISSKTYLPPPGIMPIVVLQGDPYEMGYQYALQARDYISIVRDAAWASALSKNSSQEILESCQVYRQYIARELHKFDFISFFQGITDAMNYQGFQFGQDDPVVMLYWGGRTGPQPPDHCTAIAAFANATGGGMIAGTNFDYYHLPSNSYSIILALYPDSGNSCIIPSGAGRTGSNSAFNDKGLIYILAAAPQKGPGDDGPGITGFLELPYVAMTCDTVPQAENFLINSTRMFGLNHLLLDAGGNATVLEATRARYALRRAGDNNESDYLVAANHYLNPTMKPSQPIWDPLKYYPSSYYRYITAERMIADRQGRLNYSTVSKIFSLTDWWDGKAWHIDDPWSTNTINRFRPDVATLYSAIAVPGDHKVSICTGNPGMPYWGTLASGQTGTYVNLTIGKRPEELVFDLKKDASAAMWKTVQVMEEQPPEEAADLWAEAENNYWKAVWWLDRGVLAKKAAEKAACLGRSATSFAEVIVQAEVVQAACAQHRQSRAEGILTG